MNESQASTPFKGRVVDVPIPTLVMRRFEKPDRHVAEIHERAVTRFDAIEWLLYVDDALIESRFHHGARVPLYPSELAEVIEDLTRNGWTESSVAAPQV